MTENILKNSYSLDEYQKKVVISNDKYLLVSAGAGSGKTFTIIEKIKYLIETEHINENEIICISFTNNATNNLKEKLKKNHNYNIPCYTFHKLGLTILENKYKIENSNTLDYIIHEFFENIIYYNSENIKRVLTFLNIHKKRNIIQQYKQIDNNDLDKMKKLINKFINLFKSNNHQKQDFKFFLKQAKNKKHQAFIILTYNIYYLYQQELKSKKELDFNDMISLATKKINQYGYKEKAKYIIIDEFQDTSKVRFDLIKAIINKTNAKLLVVGDDFQSIYRFTGCDLNIFINFKKEFKDASILKLENTYRNSQELIKVAGSFIMKNKNQIKKNLKSTKQEKYPIIIIYYKNLVTSFIKLIEQIYKETKKPILVLGRNNFDINNIINNKFFTHTEEGIIYKNNKNIKLKYLTIHKAKGLEEENVIIINLINKKTGFPNKIETNQVLKYVSYKEDDYPYAEERRLFYVAITRTKNKNYLLTQKNKESIFVLELKRNYKKYIKIYKLFFY